MTDDAKKWREEFEAAHLRQLPAKWREEIEGLRKLPNSARLSESTVARLREIHKALHQHSEQTPAEQPPAKPKHKRAKGGGRKPSNKPDEIEQSKAFARNKLREDPVWRDKQYAFCLHVKTKMKLGCSWQTVRRLIVKPVLDERTRRRK
jgi:hypothetical protein